VKFYQENQNGIKTEAPEFPAALSSSHSLPFMTLDRRDLHSLRHSDLHFTENTLRKPLVKNTQITWLLRNLNQSCMFTFMFMSSRPRKYSLSALPFSRLLGRQTISVVRHSNVYLPMTTLPSSRGGQKCASPDEAHKPLSKLHKYSLIQFGPE